MIEISQIVNTTNNEALSIALASTSLVLGSTYASTNYFSSKNSGFSAYAFYRDNILKLLDELIY